MEDFYFTEFSGNCSIYYSPECKSTSGLAREVIKLYPATLPAVVYTFHQTAGRGQGSNFWESEPGKNLAMTLAIEVPDPGLLIQMNKAIALALCVSIEKLTETETKIKWPNDILIFGSKTAGILIETIKTKSKLYLLAGVGVNVNQEKWKGDFQATSLRNETDHNWELIEVLREIVSNISHYIIDIKDKIMPEFNSRIWKLNDWVLLTMDGKADFRAKILGIDDSGRLLFEDNAQKVNKKHHGEVRISKNNSDFSKI